MQFYNTVQHIQTRQLKVQSEELKLLLRKLWTYIIIRGQ